MYLNYIVRYTCISLYNIYIYTGRERKRERSYIFICAAAHLAGALRGTIVITVISTIFSNGIIMTIMIIISSSSSSSSIMSLVLSSLLLLSARPFCRHFLLCRRRRAPRALQREPLFVYVSYLEWFCLRLVYVYGHIYIYIYTYM